MELSSPKNLIKPFYTLNKTPLGETGCLSHLYYLLPAHAPCFLIDPGFPNIVRTVLLPYHSLCSTCVTYRMSCNCHA